MEEYQVQNELVEKALTMLGGLTLGRGGNDRVQLYVATFGLVQPEQHMFGEFVWHGMANLLSRYVHAYKYDILSWIMPTNIICCLGPCQQI